MKFSIIIPVYNVDKYIEECIYSILFQVTHATYEVILINDGSTDKSLDIINKFIVDNCLETSNWNVYSQKNSGLSAARNLGLYYARGEYVLFLDSDDALALGALCILHNTLKVNDVEVLCFAGKDFIDRKLCLETTSFSTDNVFLFDSYSRTLFDNQLLLGSEFLFRSYDEGVFYTNACFHCVKRGFLINSQIKFLEGVYFEDNLFTRHLYLVTNSLFVINTPIILHRQRLGSIMNSNWNNRKTSSMLKVINALYNLSNYDSRIIIHANDLLMNLIRHLRRFNFYFSPLEFLQYKFVITNSEAIKLIAFTYKENIKGKIKKNVFLLRFFHRVIKTSK